MKQNDLNKHGRRSLLCIVHCALCIGMMLVSCDKDEDNIITFNSTPEKELQGIFTGIYVRVQNGTTDTLRAEGTMTLTATDTLYMTKITFDSNEMTELAGIVAIPANISHADRGYMFYNKSGDNTLTGRVSDGHTVQLRFSKLIRISARKSIRYNYLFTGRKQ